MDKKIDPWIITILITLGTFSTGSGQFPWLTGQKPESKILTRLNGCPISDKFDIETAGPHGPLMGEDGQFIEELGHFTNERLPERVVHAKGYGAFGVFTPTNTRVISRYTKASLFTVPDVNTKVAVRFSTTIGSKGSSDSVRDNRGFAIKFYSNSGNFDLLTLSFPVFFVRDPLRFIYFIHSQKPDPVGIWPVEENSFNFLATNPESLHAYMYLYSDAGTPNGFRWLPGYAVNTFRLTNSTGGMVWARFNLVADEGIQNLTREESIRISGLDPSYAAKDLYESIREGNYPIWTLRVQILDFEQIASAPFDVFDATKIWWEDQFPSIEIGKLILNHNPENEFAQMEQLAFKPSNLIPGIAISPDKVLQGRIPAYIIAQNYRLGVNNYKLPVNTPIRPIVNPTARDGAYVCDSNQGSTPNFLPNLYSPQFKSASQYYSDSWQPFEPCTVGRYNSLNDDNFSQPGELWKVLKPQDRNSLVTNMGMDLLKVSVGLQAEVIKVVNKASAEFAEQLTKFLHENRRES
ncbi:catalase-like [Panonychus citri]|uniref:catalase-like n=1 Tax=Panonychus citri TaxID=50023 RepID=UPI002307D7CC|nr:catalase-like [Panonychus citri]